MRKILLIGFGILICSLFLQGTILQSGNAYAEVKQLSMGTASVGGFFYNVGAPVAQCINKALPEYNVTAEFTEGSVENLHDRTFREKWDQDVRKGRGRRYARGRALAAQRQYLDNLEEQ
jgi:hypothetical protein